MNTAINLVERRTHDLSRRALAVHIPDAPDMVETQLADQSTGPERLLLNVEAAALRRAAMQALTPMERTAFTMRHMEDMPLTEIAETLEVPVNSVKQAIFRAVSKLRQSLAPLAGGLR